MRYDLARDQWSAIDTGTVMGPDGRRYMRRGTRMKRKQAGALVASGCPLLVYWPGGLPEKTRVEWFDGTDALSAWSSHRSAVTTDPSQTAKGSTLTAGLWESVEEEPLLVLTWHH
ncbi:hypothetical protein BL253_33375 [Pseudofrankia asymbiotica]|uniref:Uncharacterized protein n=1 Tax=Pseudofrankia asymbiotica TaxID=1834516 RepID=A0A1V2I186_9ACTN|nr:hypothetical protein BL253_33375 [Pseudofrankia asymbiotica]